MDLGYAFERSGVCGIRSPPLSFPDDVVVHHAVLWDTENGVWRLPVSIYRG